MSQLEQLCGTLTAVDQDIVNIARELHQRAQTCNRAAQYAASALRNDDGSTNPAAKDAATALSSAARAAAQAAVLLSQAANQGQAFISRTLGTSAAPPGGATTRGANNQTGATGTNDRTIDAPAVRLAGTPSKDLASLPALGAAVAGALTAASASLTRWDTEDRQLCEKWFGTSEESTRQRLANIVQRMQKHADELSLVPFEPGKGGPSTFAYVYPSDPQRRVFVGDLFWSSDTTPPDSQAGVILHELSHFSDIGGTSDHAYGTRQAEELSASAPRLALDNADNIEYYFEEFMNQ